MIRMHYSVYPGDPKRMRTWSSDIATATQEAMMQNGITQSNMPLKVHAIFVLPRAKHTPKSREHHLTAPGSFALAGIVREGLKGILYPSTREGTITQIIVEKTLGGPCQDIEIIMDIDEVGR